MGSGKEGDTAGPELLLGLVSPIGVDHQVVCAALAQALTAVRYETREVSLIEPVLRLSGRDVPDAPLDARYAGRMSAGNEFRAQLGRNDAVALAGIAEIRSMRKAATGDASQPLSRTAYVLRSLKTPEEVELLRKVYGSNFLLIAAYSPRETRGRDLADRIAASAHVANADLFSGTALHLISRDEAEQGVAEGQNLRETFPLADVFVDASNRLRLEQGILRFIELVFGHPFRTPYKDETGMFSAHAAALGSASFARQVGAAICTSTGDVVAVGMNEVPKAFGGQYGAEDRIDQRDHARAADSSSTMIRNILHDTLCRLRKLGWLEESRTKLSSDDLLAEAERALQKPLSTSPGDPQSLAEKAYVFSLLEFLRAVHGEMAALMCAARNGSAVGGCTLYTTTFPCHECARHIVVAGIGRVVFIEPYPKSRALQLYDDSISVDGGDANKVPFEAYVGVAPRAFIDFFMAPRRRGMDGKALEWEKMRTTQSPRYARGPNSYLNGEKEHMDLLDRLLQVKSATGGGDASKSG